MATIYRLLEGSKLGANVLLQRRVLTKAAPRIAATKANEIASKAQAHYSNSIRQIAAVLRESNFPGIERSRAFVIPLFTPTGKRVSMRTSVWPALSLEYADQNPYSNTYWYKRGWLSQRFMADMPPNAGKVSFDLTRLVTGKKSTRVHMEFDFPRLRDPMDSYIRKSFVEGIRGKKVIDRGYVKSGRINRIGSSRPALGTLVYVESRRPFISQAASTLGRNLLKELRN